MAEEKQPEKNQNHTEDKVDEIKGETCPMCHQKTLVLREADREIPYFGKAYLFSMQCENSECNYYKADIELEGNSEPVRYSLNVEKEDDLKARVVKSGDGRVVIPRIGSIDPGPASNGYITNIEGVINRIKRIIEQIRDNQDEEKEARKKAKNQVKKLQNVLWGRDSIKVIIEDPTGNSAIISDKAVKEKLNVKKKK